MLTRDGYRCAACSTGKLSDEVEPWPISSELSVRLCESCRDAADDYQLGLLRACHAAGRRRGGHALDHECDLAERPRFLGEMMQFIEEP